MGKLLTKHFSVDEMACKCCGVADMQREFMQALQTLRDEFGKPMIVTSGYRCKKWNDKVGGSKDSYHMKGRAVDIHLVGSVDRAQMVKLAFKHGFRGIGIDKSFIHLDNRSHVPVIFLY